jgi:hypothetical protein
VRPAAARPYQLSACQDDQMPMMAARFSTLITHGLLSTTEEKLVGETLGILGRQGSHEENLLLENIRTNRELKQQIKNVEARIDHVNALLAKSIIALKANYFHLPEEMQQLSTLISILIESRKESTASNRYRTGPQIRFWPCYDSLVCCTAAPSGGHRRTRPGQCRTDAARRKSGRPFLV